MAMIECAACHRRMESREAAYCLECAAPLCAQCEREGEGCCTACRTGPETE